MCLRERERERERERKDGKEHLKRQQRIIRLNQLSLAFQVPDFLFQLRQRQSDKKYSSFFQLKTQSVRDNDNYH